MWMVECSSETRHAIRWLLRVRPTCDLAAPIVVLWKTESWRTRIGRAQCKSLRSDSEFHVGNILQIDAQIDVWSEVRMLETSFHFLHVALLAIMWVAEVLRAILGDRS